MRPKYHTAEDFLCTKVEPKEDIIEKKINMLYDMRILRKTPRSRDPREKAVRDVLASYQTEIGISNALHDIVRGDKSLRQFLVEKGAL